MSRIVEQIVTLPSGIDWLVQASRHEGFSFLTRLVDEWQSNENRFALPGEALFAASLDEELAGVCGLNIDPFAADPHVARIRHLYVAPERRRRGIGEALLRATMDHAVRHGFMKIRLRTDTLPAAHFYERHGFSRSTERVATHVLDLSAVAG
jgi:GNAT superfamily N-acetyltransferase